MFDVEIREVIMAIELRDESSSALELEPWS